jgi:hypothetical protein
MRILLKLDNKFNLFCNFFLEIPIFNFYSTIDQREFHAKSENSNSLVLR